MNIKEMLNNLSEEDLKNGLEKLSAYLSPEQKKSAEDAIKTLKKDGSNAFDNIKEQESLDKENILNMLKQNPALLKNVSAILNKEK